MRALLLLVLLNASALAVSVSLERDRVQGNWGVGRITKQKMEAVETKECPTAADGVRALRLVGNRCEYLRGIYRVEFVDEEKTTRVAVIPFAVSRSAGGSAFLEEPAYILSESR